MTDTEKRELDAWIAVNIMKWQEVKPWDINPGHGQFVIRHGVPVAPPPIFKFEPTTDPAAAMEVLKKCAAKLYPSDEVQIYGNDEDGGYVIFSPETKDAEGFVLESDAKTLELAICLFAKKLFSK
jgi:hypothetical protein